MISDRRRRVGSTASSWDPTHSLTQRQPTVMLTAAISGAVIHPLMIRRDDETLRTQLRTLAERFLGIA